MTVWITIATGQTSAKILYKPHPFYHRFLKTVPCENNNKKHEQDYRYLSTATPYRMKYTHFCYYLYCSVKLNNVPNLHMTSIFGEKKNQNQNKQTKKKTHKNTTNLPSHAYQKIPPPRNLWNDMKLLKRCALWVIIHLKALNYFW